MRPWVLSVSRVGLVALLLGVGASAWAQTSLPEHQTSLPEQYHRLHPGNQREIVIPGGIRGYAVRDEDMVQVRQGDSIHKLLLIAGMRRGITEVLLFKDRGPFRRLKIWIGTSGDGMQMICVICKVFPEGNALWIESVGDGHLVVKGTAYTLEEARAVMLVMSEYRQVSADVQVTERAVREGLLRVNHALWSEGFLDARAVVVGHQVLLTGRFKSDEEESRARATLAPHARWLEERLGLPVLSPAR
jgi:hypothetical protein